MSGAGAIVIRVDSLIAKERLERALAAIQVQPLLKRIGERLKGFVDESFRTRGRGAWAPLAWSTVAMRAHGGSVPLQDTGSYKQSWTSRTFVTPDGGYAEVGTAKTPLAFWLEYGTGTFAGKGPYTIRIRNAKVLAARFGGGAGQFQMLGGGAVLRGGKNANWVFFGKEVQHPGIPGRPVLPTTAEGEKLLDEVVKGVEDQIAGKGP